MKLAKQRAGYVAGLAAKAVTGNCYLYAYTWCTDFQLAKGGGEVRPFIGWVLLWIAVLVFHRQVFGALHDVLGVPVLAACRKVACEAMHQEYREFVVPYWAKIRSTFDPTVNASIASTVRTRKTQ